MGRYFQFVIFDSVTGLIHGTSLSFAEALEQGDINDYFNQEYWNDLINRWVGPSTDIGENETTFSRSELYSSLLNYLEDHYNSGYDSKVVKVYAELIDQMTEEDRIYISYELLE